MQEKYSPKKVELYVQKYWKKNKTFEVTEDINKKKYYCLSMMPYPSGNLHIGHVRNYTIGDVIARYQRMLGKNVLHPIGWDAFGLPAENAAIKNNISPSTWTYNNIKYMKKQLQSLGFSYDWNRELTTCKSEYYVWEQWLFTELYKKKLAYKKTAIVNWCPKDKTVLANEQVIKEHCWRCNSKIELKKIPQWFLRITKYAEELLNDLDKLKHWPKEVIKMQRNWIGRSDGFEITFNIVNSRYKLVVYTTRPDTIMGVTYILISTKHELSLKQAKKNKKINDFINIFNKLSSLNKQEIKGIYTNITAIHPLTKEHIPVWISNIVILGYGTDAVMAVPELDKKDWEFANKYKLNTKSVMLNKKDSIIIVNTLYEKRIIKKKTNYRLQDWCISRQRYWGTPIPIFTNKEGKNFPIPKKYLPIKVSKKNTKYSFNTTKKINLKNKEVFLDNDTFDTFIESSWYYARYTCPRYKVGMIDKTKANYWLPIDQYVGGIEHANLHLMYFRFFHKILRDIGLVTSDEPAKHLLCQGMVVSDTFYRYENKNIFWVSPKEVKITKNKEGKIIKTEDLQGRTVVPDGTSKMSKSKNNGIDPEILVKKYGADTVRLFIMFAAPVEMKLKWNDSNIKGMHRFLKRIWKLVYDYINKKPKISSNILKINNNSNKLKKYLHKTIAKVSHDIDKRQSFNTAIASIMELVNKLIYFSKKNLDDTSIIKQSLFAIIKMLAPFTPHISFFLWKKIGGIGDIDYASWPKFDPNILVEKKITIVIQINGKKKSIIILPNTFTEDQVKKHALQDKLIKKYISKLTIIKVIYISKKIINFITKFN